MKAKDIVQEGLFGDLTSAASSAISSYKSSKSQNKASVGDRLSAFFSPDRRKYGRSSKDQYAAQKFIDKFVSRGLEVLNAAVKNDLVDPNANTIASPAAAKPAAKKPAKKTAKKTSAQTQQPVSKKKPPPPTSSTLIIPEDAHYEKMNFLFESIIEKLDEAPGYTNRPASNLQTPPGANPVKGKKPAAKKSKVAKKSTAKSSSAVPYPQRPLNPSAPASATPQGGGRLKGAPLSQTPNAVKKRQQRAANKSATQTTAAGTQQQPAKTSISQYFKDNFLDQFLQGINMAPAKPKIDNILKNLPQMYQQKTLKKELQDLGNVAWSLATAKLAE